MCTVEEIDAMIIPTLRKLGCEFEAPKLMEFTQENIYEAITRCLLQICPTFSHHSCRLPQNMGDRFRTGTIMADKIKELGFREDIGYQTILYGNHIEIRRLLIFLIERLPKEAEKPTSTVESPRELLYKSLGRALKIRLAEPTWVPWFCKRYSFEWDGRFWYRSDQRAIRFNSRPIKIDADNSLVEQTADRSNCFSSVIENNARLRYSIDDDLPVASLSKPTVPCKPTHLLKVKPKLPPKPAFSKHEPRSSLAADESVPQTSHTVQVEVQSEASNEANTYATLHELNATVGSLGPNLSRTEQELIEVLNAADKLESKLKDMEAEMNARKRITDLVPNVDVNLEKLRDYLNNSETRSTTLMSQWEQHRKQLERELSSLKHERSAERPCEKLQEEIATISDMIDTYDRECIDKEMLLGRLKNEADSETVTSARGPGRSFYTKRILEIIWNVRKQKDEIDRILDDVKVTQKDINMLSGKLERTYRAADELMFEDAKRDELIKRAYKVFVSLHETCSDTTSDVEITGQVLREIRDLEDKVELETQNGVDKKLEMLVTNLCEIREENKKLMLELNK